MIQPTQHIFIMFVNKSVLIMLMMSLARDVSDLCQGGKIHLFAPSASAPNAVGQVEILTTSNANY